jgi:riboflavin kinase/FMN adenylyltransferase
MPTTLIRSLHHLTATQQGCVMTIGNFDGVHIGHQQLLAKVVAEAKTRQVPSLAVTFEPHPFEFFAQEKLTIPRLTRLREKFCAIAACGIDYVLILTFNQSLATLSATTFATTVLGEALRPKHIIVGDDFHFGHQRQGDFHLLQVLGESLGFSVEAMPTVWVDDVRVSSTRVRQALAVGDHALAGRLLGHPYSMLGRVGHGDKLGRQLGFPTANIFLHRRLTPVHGIYTVYVHGVADRPWPGAANMGTRPTVNGTRTLLEVHLLDFHQDIYGRYVQVEFCQKLRDEERYSTLDLLKQQIAKDVEQAKIYFNRRV